MEVVMQKLKSMIGRLENVPNSSHDFFSKYLLSEEELIFEEMDLIIREEINRLEQILTDYLKAQLSGRINCDIEDRYVSRITELYEKWAFLEPPKEMNSSNSTFKEFELEEKQKQLKKRRTILENKIVQRITEWKKVPTKKAIIEFENGILIGNGFRKGTMRTLKYTLIVIHQR